MLSRLRITLLIEESDICGETCLSLTIENSDEHLKARPGYTRPSGLFAFPSRLVKGQPFTSTENLLVKH